MPARGCRDDIVEVDVEVLAEKQQIAYRAPPSRVVAKGGVDQDGALEVTVVDGECFIATSTSEIVITVTDIIDEYESREIQTGTEVFSEELIPADCPEVIVDEVLGLAITGSNVNMPVAVGASLIGAGGLLVAAARKRRNELS